MKSFIIWTGIILLAYFASDIIDKGNNLNELTPWPIFGYLLWGLILFFIWYWVMHPIIQFIMLKRHRDTTQRKHRQVALRHLKARLKEEKSNTELQEFYRRLRHANVKDEAALSGLLTEFSAKHDQRRQKGLDIIMQHSKAAAVAVVFNRNNLLDGIIMLVVQAKLIIALAVAYGYKPSPVFNALCMGWVICNSLLTALFAQDAAELAGEAFAETISELVSDPSEIGENYLDKLAAGGISILVEAALSGTTVYVTGRIFLRSLLRESRPTQENKLQELIRYRREGRACMRQQLMNVAPDILKNVGARIISPVVDVAKSAAESIATGTKKATGWLSKLNPFS